MLDGNSFPGFKTLRALTLLTYVDTNKDTLKLRINADDEQTKLWHESVAVSWNMLLDYASFIRNSIIALRTCCMLMQLFFVAEQKLKVDSFFEIL